MKATTKKTLSELASIDSGEVRGLVLDPGLYPESSIEAATEAFREYCRVLRDTASGEISLQVRPEHISESRQVIGAFLNFLVCSAVSRRER